MIALTAKKSSKVPVTDMFEIDSWITSLKGRDIERDR